MVGQTFLEQFFSLNRYFIETTTTDVDMLSKFSCISEIIIGLLRCRT